MRCFVKSCTTTVIIVDSDVVEHCVKLQGDDVIMLCFQTLLDMLVVKS